MRPRPCLLPLLLLAALPAGSARGQDGLDPPPAPRRTLALEAGPGWRAVARTEGERGSWLLRGEDGAARVRLYRRGRRGAALEADVARWAASFVGQDGEPLAPAVARIERVEGAGVPCTLVELRGEYVAPPYPGAEEVPSRPGWVGLHARFEGPDGLWTATLLGPEAAVARWRASFLVFVRGARVVSLGAGEDPGEEEADGEGAGAGGG